MIETEKRSECWFSSTQKWHKTIPFLLLLLFFHFSFFSMFCLKLWLFLFHCTYILHTHLHSMSFLVFIRLFLLSFILASCIRLCISRGDNFIQKKLFFGFVCVHSSFFSVFYWHLNCILFCCWHTLHSRTIFILTFLFSLRKVNSKQTNHIGMFMEINDQTIQKALWQTWILFESFSLRGM